MNNNFQLLQKKYNQKSKDFDKKLLKVPLKEVGENLVYLPTLSKKYKLNIVYVERDKAFLRESIAIQFMKSAEFFNKKGFILKVYSTYRSLDEQKSKFITRYQSMKNSFPEKPRSELLKLANTYTAGIPILAAHTGGAAIDVTLLDKNGKLLDFGVPYPHGDIESITDYPNFSKKVKGNRKILKDGMEKYSFINYPFEYWHYSIGDVCATYLSGKKFAKFGPVNYNFKNERAVFPKQKKDYTHFLKFL